MPKTLFLAALALAVAACDDDDNDDFDAAASDAETPHNPRRDAGPAKDATADSAIPADTAVEDASADSSEEDASQDAESDAESDADTDADAESDADTDADAESDAESDAETDAQIPPVCNPGSAYSAGNAIFKERPLKFANAPAAGSRLSVGDFDDDGFPDLAVRQPGNTPDILGENPVRQAWLLHNDFGQLLADEAAEFEGELQDQPAFSDVSVSSGFLAVRNEYSAPIGRPMDVVVFGDVDNDGDLDLYTGFDASSAASVTVGGEAISVSESCEILLNDGQGHFDLVDASSAVRKQKNPGGAAFTDFNRDGFLDLWLPQNGEQDALFQGNAAGEFKNVTRAMGLQTKDWNYINELNQALGHSVAWSAAACDLNDDGYPELLAASYGRAPNHLWQGGETYQNRSIASGYAYDQNFSWTDNQFARCYCQSNRSAAGCADVPAPLISCSNNWTHSQDREAFRLGGNSAATVCADFDGDGDIDLFTTEIKHWWAGEGSDESEILLNSGEPDVRFERPGREATGLAMQHPQANWDEGHMTATAFDFDNDGRPDLYLGASDYAGNYGHLYHNVSEGGQVMFEEVPLEDFFEHNRSHGVVAADFDRDGDLDLVVGHSRSRCDASSPHDCYSTTEVRYFENVMGQDGNWIQLDLRGAEGTNPLAIGARVTVKSASTSQTQEVSGGYGHYGAQNDRILHFGLGADCEAEVTVTWPNQDRTTERFTLNAGSRYKVLQGEIPAPLPSVTRQ